MKSTKKGLLVDICEECHNKPAIPTTAK